MKKLLVLCVIGLAGILMAAAPAINNWAAPLGASIEIDSQWTAGQWELVDSIIVIKTDTCYTVYTFNGVAALDYGDKLYIGFDDGGGAGGLPVDTFIIQGIENPGVGKARVSFSFRYNDSLISQTDENDTIYFYAAVGGSGASEKVQIEDGLLTAEVYDFNAAGVIGE